MNEPYVAKIAGQYFGMNNKYPWRLSVLLYIFSISIKDAGPIWYDHQYSGVNNIPLITQLNNIQIIVEINITKAIFIFNNFSLLFFIINFFNPQNTNRVNTLTITLNIAPIHPPAPAHKKLKNPLKKADVNHHLTEHIKAKGIKKTKEISRFKKLPNIGNGKYVFPMKAKIV